MSDAPEDPVGDMSAPASPVASAEPHAAYGRPGPTAPRVAGGDLSAAIPADLDHAITVAEQLIRQCREPRSDALWPHVEPTLKAEYSRLQRELNDRWYRDPDVLMFYKLKHLLGLK